LTLAWTASSSWVLLQVQWQQQQQLSSGRLLQLVTQHQLTQVLGPAAALHQMLQLVG
jgi:hypothetical protein